jgi:hypothetical protein
MFVVVVSNCFLLRCQLLRYRTVDYMQISQAVACRSLRLLKSEEKQWSNEIYIPFHVSGIQSPYKDMHVHCCTVLSPMHVQSFCYLHSFSPTVSRVFGHENICTHCESSLWPCSWFLLFVPICTQCESNI